MEIHHYTETVVEFKIFFSQRMNSSPHTDCFLYMHVAQPGGDNIQYIKSEMGFERFAYKNDSGSFPQTLH